MSELMDIVIPTLLFSGVSFTRNETLQLEQKIMPHEETVFDSACSSCWLHKRIMIHSWWFVEDLQP